MEVRNRYIEDTSLFHVRLRKGHLEEAPAAAGERTGLYLLLDNASQDYAFICEKLK